MPRTQVRDNLLRASRSVIGDEDPTPVGNTLDSAGDQPITGENCPVEIEQKGVVAVEQLKPA